MARSGMTALGSFLRHPCRIPVAICPPSAFQSRPPGRLHALPHEPALSAVAMGHPRAHSSVAMGSWILLPQFWSSSASRQLASYRIRLAELIALVGRGAVLCRDDHLGRLAARGPSSHAAASRAIRPLPPNILMIGSDTLRADRLGALGYHRALTPHIDALAAARRAVRQLLRALRPHRTQPDFHAHRHLAPHPRHPRQLCRRRRNPAQGRCPAAAAEDRWATAPRHCPTGAAPTWENSPSASTTPICQKISGI